MGVAGYLSHNQFKQMHNWQLSGSLYQAMREINDREQELTSRTDIDPYDPQHELLFLKLEELKAALSKNLILHNPHRYKNPESDYLKFEMRQADLNDLLEILKAI